MQAKDGERVYKLRPHHGMCLAFFIGEGYSDAFSVNMRGMLELFLSGASVRMCLRPDEICGKCPNLKKGAFPEAGGVSEAAVPHAEGMAEKASGKPEESPENIYVCSSEEKVMRYDRKVLSTCGLEEGDVLSFGEFTGKVQADIIETGIRKEICADCCWDYICGSVKSLWERHR